MADSVLHLVVDDVEFDIVSNKCYGFNYSAGYSHPARLTWFVNASQETLPIDFQAHIIFYDEIGGTGFDALDVPLFEGHVHEIEPVGSNTLQYTAYDPTFKAGQTVTVFSDDWTDATTPAATAVPRAIWNSAIDNDDDYAFEKRSQAQVGVIDINVKV